MTKITVIGGAGFIGTNLCQSLADRQIPFEIIDLRQSLRFPEKCKIADVRDADSLQQAITGDIVVNLAAVHRDDVRDLTAYERTNVDGAINVAKACTALGITKIVFTSTVAVYGFAAPGTDESGKINPFNAYGETKFRAEEALRKWQSDAANALIIVRPTVVFGEGNRGNVYNLLRQIASGRFVMVGSGKNRKSMAYVGNVTAFLEKCIETEQSYAVYNYVDTPDMDMNALVGLVRKSLTGRTDVGRRLPYWLGLALGYVADGVARLTGRSLPISAIRVKKFCASTSFGSAKADLDDFQPPYTLQEGLERTLQYEFISPPKSGEVFYTE